MLYIQKVNIENLIAVLLSLYLTAMVAQSVKAQNYNLRVVSSILSVGRRFSLLQALKKPLTPRLRVRCDGV